MPNQELRQVLLAKPAETKNLIQVYLALPANSVAWPFCFRW
jgi:hypothetical protein